MSSDIRQTARLVYEACDTFLAHRDGLVVVIEVYLDESGTDRNTHVIGVSAVWASKDTWRNWTLDWLPAKAPIRIYHAVDCHNREGEYRGWSRPRRDQHVRNLLPVVRNHYIRGVVAAVDKSAIAHALKRKHDIEIHPDEMIRGWYFICLVWAIRDAWEQLSEAGHKAIAFVHEENQYRHEAMEAYSLVKKRMMEDGSTFGMGSKLDFTPLQCADMLAYEGNHQVRDMSRPRKPMMAIDPTNSRFKLRKYDNTEIDEIVDFTADYLKRISAEFSK